MSASEAEARAPRDERADVSPNGPLVPFGFFTTERLCFFFERRRRERTATLAFNERRRPTLSYTLYETLTVNH